MPLQVAKNPQSRETMVLVDNQWVKAEQMAVNPTDQSTAYLVGGKWLQDTPGPTAEPKAPGMAQVLQGETPAEQRASGLLREPGKKWYSDLLDWGQWKQAGKNVGETAASLATGAVGQGAGLLSKYGGLMVNPQDTREKGEARKAALEEQLTYQPRDESGQRLAATVGYIPGKILQGADVIDPSHTLRDVLQTGALVEGVRAPLAARGRAPKVDPAATAARAADMERAGGNIARRLQGKPTVAAPERPAAGPAPTGASGPAEARAADYAQRHGIDWASAADAFRKNLARIAEDAEGLGKLDPEAVKRVARAAAVKAPISRGQATRNLVDITDEENLKRTTAGDRIRKKSAQQDTAMHDELTAIRQKVAPTSKVADASDVGASVQGAARRKLQVLKAQASVLYDDAKAKGEMEKPVDPKPLLDWLEEDPGRRANLKWLPERIKEYSEKAGGITLQNMENLRGEISRASGESGRKGGFAGDALAVMDQVLDRVDSASYKQARGKWRAMKEEMEQQGAVRNLVTEMANTTDRRIALEDTLNRVIRGSNEGLNNIKSTLLRGGTAMTRRRGAKAWKDLQAGVIEHLREAAAGRRAIKGEDAQLQFNSSFLDALQQLKQGGKLETLFGKEVAARVTQLAETVRDLRTTPADRVVGPQTALRIFRMLEHATKIPLGIGKLVEHVAETRATTRAVTDPLEAAAKKAPKPPSRKRTAAGTAAPFLLQDENERRAEE